MNFTVPPSPDDLEAIAQDVLANLPEELLEFCDFVYSGSVKEEYIIVGGHSIGFRYFFRIVFNLIEKTIESIENFQIILKIINAIENFQSWKKTIEYFENFQKTSFENFCAKPF